MNGVARGISVTSYVPTCSWQTSCVSIHWLGAEHWAQTCGNVCREERSSMYVLDGKMVMSLLCWKKLVPRYISCWFPATLLKCCYKPRVPVLLPFPLVAGLTVCKATTEVHELSLSHLKIFSGSSGRNHLESDINHNPLETWENSVGLDGSNIICNKSSFLKACGSL